MVNSLPLWETPSPLSLREMIKGYHSMIVGACRVELFLPESHSLKEKRHVIKSIVARVHNQFNVSAAEVEEQDLWQRAVLGIAVVTNDTHHANEVLSNIVNFVESASPAVEMIDYQIDITPVL